MWYKYIVQFPFENATLLVFRQFMECYYRILGKPIHELA